MPKKIEPNLKFETLERYCDNPRELIYFMSGYFESFTLNYKGMSKNEIKENIESLKVCFDFLESLKNE